MRINPDAAKIRDNKKNRHLFILSPIFLAKSKYSSYLCKKNLWKEDYSQKAILKT